MITLVFLISLSITPEEKGLEYGCQKTAGARVCYSPHSQYLGELAGNHARYMASIGVQGHQNFNQRFQWISGKYGSSAAEICAESWAWQSNDSMEQLGIEMFKCWKQSPGHWSVASKRHSAWGGGMARGRNGIWYACILVADGGTITGDAPQQQHQPQQPQPEHKNERNLLPNPLTFIQLILYKGRRKGNL